MLQNDLLLLSTFYPIKFHKKDCVHCSCNTCDIVLMLFLIANITQAAQTDYNANQGILEIVKTSCQLS